MQLSLSEVVASVPAGAWAVGVSGGADSVALLSLLHQRADVSLHVVHLDHETRGIESENDALFVADLARQWQLPCTSARRSEIESALSHPPANISARYRAVRLQLFHQVVQRHHLLGVILAHHADDQAETVLQRLLRGSGYAGLAGIAPRAQVGGLLILHPLLPVRREALREYLRANTIAWREDRSNQSDKYLRNRLRRVLSEHSSLVPALLALGEACGRLRDAARGAAPVLGEEFFGDELADLPLILAEESARQWLIERGVPIDQVDRSAIERLILMSSDAASPPRQDFAGAVHIRRARKGMITART